MFFLERKEPVAMPNVLGNTSQPVHTYRWKAIYTCPERCGQAIQRQKEKPKPQEEKKEPSAKAPFYTEKSDEEF